MHFVLSLFFCAAAQHATWTNEDSIKYMEHLNELKWYADVESDDFFTSICMKYSVKSEDSQTILKLIRGREYKKYACNYLFKFSRERVNEKMKIDSLYQDSIFTLLIPYNHDISGKNISLALELSDTLSLSKRNYDFLMNKALMLARKKSIISNSSFVKEEMDILKKRLSKKQIEIIINKKNSSNVYLKAFGIWNKLDKSNLTEELDSTVQMFLMQKYFSLKMFYEEYYVSDSIILKRNQEELYKHRPTAIRMYEAIDIRNRINAEAKEEKKNSVRNAFAW